MPSRVAKSLSRLSRDKLLSLCTAWSKSAKCDPYLVSNRNPVESEEEDYLHEPARTRQELRTIYSAFQTHGSDLNTLSKKDIIDRIIDGDWRRGLSHEQLATIDFANLEENDTSLRWSALKLVPLDADIADNVHCRPAKRRKLEHAASTSRVPRCPDTTATVFVQNLKTHISPLVKAHYHIHRMATLRLSIVRLYIAPNAPFAPLSANVPRQGKGATDAARTMYIALPDSCPYVYVSIPGLSSVARCDKPSSAKSIAKVDIAATKRIVLEAIPKALSRPQQRWSLESTKLVARSLQAMTLLRGSTVVGASGGCFTGLAQPQINTTSTKDDLQEERNVHPGAASTVTPTELLHQRQVEHRFGNMNASCHARLDCVQVKVENIVEQSTKGRKRKYDDACDSEELAPMIITMTGTDVFAGLKQFALAYPGYVDMNRLPAAFTGEVNTTQIKL